MVEGLIGGGDSVCACLRLKGKVRDIKGEGVSHCHKKEYQIRDTSHTALITMSGVGSEDGFEFIFSLFLVHSCDSSPPKAR